MTATDTDIVRMMVTCRDVRGKKTKVGGVTDPYMNEVDVIRGQAVSSRCETDCCSNPQQDADHQPLGNAKC